MKKVKYLSGTVLIGICLLTATVVPAYARDGQSSDSGDGATTAAVSSGGGEMSESQKQATEQQKKSAERAAEMIKKAAERRAEQQKDASSTEVENELEAKVRNRGHELELELGKKASRHSEAERKTNCQTRKQGLETKFKNLSANALKHKTQFDTVLAQAIHYANTNNIQTAAYTEALVKAQAAQAQAEGSLAVLSTLSPTLDCNNVSVASDVASFKAAAEQARNDLMAYRDATRAVMEALLEV